LSILTRLHTHVIPLVSVSGPEARQELPLAGHMLYQHFILDTKQSFLEEPIRIEKGGRTSQDVSEEYVNIKFPMLHLFSKVKLGWHGAGLSTCPYPGML
jgi:hypothetical protein